MQLRGATTDENESPLGRGRGRRPWGGLWIRERTHPGANVPPLQGGDFHRAAENTKSGRRPSGGDLRPSQPSSFGGRLPL